MPDRKKQQQSPVTEGIKYAGSKLKIIPYILDCLDGYSFQSVLDGFAGTTRVSQAFARRGMCVTCNDSSVWSEVFGNCYLKSVSPDLFFTPLIRELNGLPGKVGWFSKNYGESSNIRKRPFQEQNLNKLDAIRDAIDGMELSFEDKCVLLTSLIYALDSVDSTIGHFSSYLAQWSPRSYHTMTMKLPERFFPDPEKHEVLCGDIFEAACRNHYDLAYFDPPYGSSNEKMPPSRVRYEAYYHFWKTVVLNDQPSLFGRAGRREDTRDTVASSVFEEFRKNQDGRYVAMEALNRLIREVQADYVLLSYSSGGRATREELMDSLASNGTVVKSLKIDYRKNVMSGMTWTKEWVSRDPDNQEYLFLLKK